MAFGEATEYFERCLGTDLDQVSPEPLDGWALVGLLWPLNDLFRPRFNQVRALGYKARFEAEADEAILAFAAAPAAATWDRLSWGCWRVLLERHRQLLQLATACAMAGTTVTWMPHGLTEDQRRTGAMLLLLLRMKLPYPIADRARDRLPEPNAEPPTRLQ